MGFFKGARVVAGRSNISIPIYFGHKGIFYDFESLYYRGIFLYGYHSGCEDLQITHLWFADDLFVFIKGDVALKVKTLEVCVGSLEMPFVNLLPVVVWGSNVWSFRTGL